MLVEVPSARSSSARSSRYRVTVLILGAASAADVSTDTSRHPADSPKPRTTAIADVICRIVAKIGPTELDSYLVRSCHLQRLKYCKNFIPPEMTSASTSVSQMPCGGDALWQAARFTAWQRGCAVVCLSLPACQPHALLLRSATVGRDIVVGGRAHASKQRQHEEGKPLPTSVTAPRRRRRER